MTGIEHRELKGITLRNMIVTIVSTASIVATVMGTYYQNKQDMQDMRAGNDKQTAINDLRIRALENHILLDDNQISIIQQQISELQKHQKNN